MSKKANATVIGSFVLGAVALGVAAILVFGGGKFFEKEHSFVAYFVGSVRGLDVGAPVRFRGVQVGQVTHIGVAYDAETDEYRVPVKIALVEGRVEGGELARRGKSLEEHFEGLLKRGLRARLDTDSFLTGKLFVALDLQPDSPIRRLGRGDIPELPTVETDFQKLRRKLEDMPIQELLEAAVQLVKNLDTLVGSPESKNAVNELNEALAGIEKLAEEVSTEVKPLSESIRATMDQARQTLGTIDQVTGEDVKSLVRNVDGHVKPLSESTLEVLGEAEKALATADQSFGERSELRLEIARLLEELAGAARAVRHLASYLERHPDALLKGKE